MDKLSIRKSLMLAMGEDAKKRKRDAFKKKYDTGNPELDRIAASQDEAVESAEMPKMEGIDVSDVDSGASAAKPAMDAARDAWDEDEEMQKWMAKQKG